MHVLQSVWLTGRQACGAGAWGDVWVMMMSPKTGESRSKKPMHRYRQFWPVHGLTEVKFHARKWLMKKIKKKM